MVQKTAADATIVDVPIARHATLRRIGFQAWVTTDRLDEVTVGDQDQPLDEIADAAGFEGPASLELTGFDLLELAAQLVYVFAQRHPTRADDAGDRLSLAVREAPFRR